jgi:GNAT superfamily N-acetyltransferase
MAKMSRMYKDYIISHKAWNYKEVGYNEKPVALALRFEIHTPEGEIVGYAHVGKTETSESGKISLDAILINEDHQRKGLATAMIQYI